MPSPTEVISIIAALISPIVAVIAAHVRTTTLVSRFQEDLNEIKALSSDANIKTITLEVKIQEMEKQHNSASANLNQHLRNTAIHVDPIRDEIRWRDLVTRLDRIEHKIDTKVDV